MGYTQISNQRNSYFENELYIPIKTLNQYICLNKTKIIYLCDYNSEEIVVELSSSNELFFTAINKIVINNSNYLIISKMKKEYNNPLENKNSLLLIEDNEYNLKKVENPLNKLIEEGILKISILDNKDIVIMRDRKNISCYIYEKQNYKKYFNNLNKGDYIFGLIKLSKNRFCFLSANNEESFIFTVFNQDFSSKEKEIKMLKPIYNLKNNIFFKTNKDKVIIIGKFEFIIFDPFLLEIQTIITTGLICYALPFNKENNDCEEIYNFLALIIWEENDFFLIIYNLFDNIKEIEKIKLNKYYPGYKNIIAHKKFCKIYREEEKRNQNEEKYEYYLKYKAILIDYQIETQYADEYIEKWNINNESSIDLFYDLKKNGDIILIVDFTAPWINNKLSVIIDFNLNKFKFE